jgi:hypothetical protein
MKNLGDKLYNVALEKLYDSTFKASKTTKKIIKKQPMDTKGERGDQQKRPKHHPINIFLMENKTIGFAASPEVSLGPLSVTL